MRVVPISTTPPPAMSCFDALRLGAGVVVAVAFHEVDNTPHCETCAEGDNERLKNRDSLIDESHRFSSLI